MTPRDAAPATGRRQPTPVMEDTMGIHPNPTDNPRPGISLPPGTIVGYVSGRPVYNIAGGAEPDDDDTDVVIDDDPEPDPADELEPDDEPEPDDKPKPKDPAKKPELKPGDPDYVPSATEWARTQAALRKANKEAERQRLRFKELEDQGRANETEHEKALREAREEGERRFREPMKKSGVKAALIEAGFVSPDRLLKLVDWEAVSVDDDGDLIGVEAEVDRVKSEYPEFLQQDKPKPRPKPNAAGRQPAPDKPKSTAERHAQSVLGRS